MKAPNFWTADTPNMLAARLLSPLQRVTAQATARRLRRPGWRAPVPVVVCGNVGVGGAGKTTLALDLATRLRTLGVAVHCLTRGYGGRVGSGPRRVDPALDTARMVGDEALLLAAVAPCWVGADRAAGARAAIEAGAELLLLDDGLQNPGLVQDMPLLVIDGAAGFGNDRLLPAGPLREPVAVAARRAACAILIGPDRHQALGRLPPALPVLHADLVMDPDLIGLRGTRLLAFAGIARPAKFFDGLSGLGLTLVDRRCFPDHHAFSAADLARLHRDAGRLQARLITTPKDAVRLEVSRRSQVLVASVGLRWADPAACDALLRRMIAARPS